MEIKVGGEWKMSTPKVGLTTSGNRCIDVQHAVVVSRAVIFASSGEGSVVGESMDIKGVVQISHGNFTASSGEGSRS